MRRGVCVKCGSDQIYVLGVYTPQPDLRLALVSVRKADSHFLACKGCGYTERYINSDRLHLLDEFGVPLAQAQAQARGRG